MAAGQGVEEYIDFNDFSHGIWSDYVSNLSAGRAAAEGTAQLTDTYGCYGHPHGGLHPLPAVGQTVTQAYPLNGRTGGAGYEPPSEARSKIVATNMFSPVVPRAGLAYTSDITDSGHPDQLHYLFHSFYSSGGTSIYKDIWDWYAYCRHKPTPDSHLLVEDIGGALTPAMHPSQLLHGFGALVQSTQHVYAPETALVPGNPIMLAAYSAGVSRGGAVGNSYFWPNWNNAARPGSYTADAGASSPAAFAVAHQGRILFNEFNRPPNGNFNITDDYYSMKLGTDSGLNTAEHFGWTAVNDPLTSYVYHGALFGEDQNSGYGSWVSMNANELFLVKQVGGAIVVRGSLDRPTVIHLPGLPSTHGATNIGALTADGYIYGTRDGVWMWGGGVGAKNISPHLTGWFWDLDDDSNDTGMMRGSVQGKFAFSYPFVFAPNNWVMDVRSGGWFRLNSTSATLSYAFYDVSSTGDVYASPSYVSASQNVLHDRYDINSVQASFKWRSQPVAKTRNRRLNFREVTIVAQGTGTVLVELIGIGGTVVAAATAAFSSDQPKIIYEPIRVTAHDIEVRITSTGTGSPAQAPVVNRVALGYNTGTTAR